jgi:hypothetical protein
VEDKELVALDDNVVLSLLVTDDVAVDVCVVSIYSCHPPLPGQNPKRRLPSFPVM